MSQRYYPTYRETPATPESWRDFLARENTNPEPSELATITDVCASAQAAAYLQDEGGRYIGSIDASGNISAAQ